MKTTFDVLLNVVWNTILFQINTIFEEFITRIPFRKLTDKLFAVITKDISFITNAKP